MRGTLHDLSLPFDKSQPSVNRQPRDQCTANIRGARLPQQPQGARTPPAAFHAPVCQSPRSLRQIGPISFPSAEPTIGRGSRSRRTFGPHGSSYLPARPLSCAYPFRELDVSYLHRPVLHLMGLHAPGHDVCKPSRYCHCMNSPRR